jgi:hypothetical protein
LVAWWLSACTLLAPDRSDYEGGEPDARDGGGLAETSAPSCTDEPGEPGPGSEVSGTGGQPLSAKAISAIAVDASYVYVGQESQLVRFDKGAGTSAGRHLSLGVVERVRILGSDVYWTSTAGAFRATASWGSNVAVAPLLSGAVGELAAVGARIFASQPALLKVVEIGGQGISIDSPGGAEGMDGSDAALYWSVRGNVQRAFQAKPESRKTLLSSTLLPAASAPSIALDGQRLAIASDRGGGCSTILVVNASDGGGTVQPSVTIPQTPRAGGWLVANSGWAFWTTGSRVVGLELTTGALRVLASGLADCSAGLAADATHVYVACASRRVFRAPR